MSVSEDDVVDLPRRDARSFKALRERAHGQASVDEERELTATDEGGVAFASTGEDLEVQEGYAFPAPQPGQWEGRSERGM